MPSERELTEQFGVSRMTARQALTELERIGYLHRMQGKGTFVASPKVEQPLVALTSFTEDMLRRGMNPGARVISVEDVPAGRKPARALGLAETDMVLRVERLRLAAGEPMALEISHLPTTLCSALRDANLEDQSLYRLIQERCGLVLVRASQSLEAVSANPYEAEILRVHEGSPLLLLERISYDPQNRPVEFVRSLYRGDRYRFTAELERRDGTDGIVPPAVEVRTATGR